MQPADNCARKCSEGITMIYLGKSDIGKVRKMNQDAFIVKQEDKMTLAFVCDGMGGAKAGEVASRMACEKIVEYTDTHPLDAQPDVQHWLHDAVAYANEAVYSASMRTPAYYGMGTTLVGLLEYDDHLYSVNVGDSRLYGFKPSLFEQITLDHSLVSEMVSRGMISEEESKNHPKRHILTNALGISRDIRIDIEEVLTSYDLLLISSDGLHSMLEDDQIQAILSTEADLPTLCDHLIDAANQAGGNDNITVILAQTEGKL
ncbi:MAG: Stp1/IreP family PP2C-type Ser/Thr phosphatase [Erysipelotrichales bacterium]|nr:MAG: Stp1/IreP family PP2C-type Ser/Thr phosphatase [Erysipelotrichales bacterium]